MPETAFATPTGSTLFRPAAWPVSPWRHWEVDCDLRPLQTYWDDLPADPYIPSGERQRRYAVARHARNGLRVLPQESHLQSRDNNPLFGGIERRLAPISPPFFDEPAFHEILNQSFRTIPARPSAWRLQIHQFRILAPGAPTPEGLHSDGADHVLMTLIERRGVTGGMTSLHAADKDGCLAQMTLTRPGESLMIDDRRVRHRVSPVGRRIRDDTPAHRDMLVVTFHAEGSLA